METAHLLREGPIAYIESTTQANVFDEDANRALLLASDESADQTRRVIDAVARLAARAAPDRGSVFAKHPTAQRLLRRAHVEVPFAEDLVRTMPDTHPNARRAVKHIFSAVKAVALLHQRHPAAGPRLAHGDTIQATAPSL